MTSVTFTSRSEAETVRCATLLGAHLVPGDVVALEGELGAGKTRFVRGLAQGGGADPAAVNSPTYILANEYPGERFVLVHIDAYRLDDDADLASLGYARGEGDGAVLAIEWAERLDEAEVEASVIVRIEHAGQHERLITLTSRRPPDRPLDLHAALGPMLSQ